MIKVIFDEFRIYIRDEDAELYFYYNSAPVWGHPRRRQEIYTAVGPPVDCLPKNWIAV